MKLITFRYYFLKNLVSFLISYNIKETIFLELLNVFFCMLETLD